MLASGEDWTIADGVAICSSEIERLPCSTFSRKYELRTSVAVSGVRKKVAKN